MVHNSEGTEPKRRGRPRAYDPDAALEQAMGAFWRSGYAGTSLDDLTAATGMNRPSLYAAFGDKRSLYLKALARYWQIAMSAMREDLAKDAPLPELLTRAFEGALSIYFSGDDGPRGCFVVSTAVTAAAGDAEIRDSLLSGFLAFDKDFEAVFRAARDNGELRKDADPAILAAMATAFMHSIAIRARSGASRSELSELARKAAATLR